MSIAIANKWNGYRFVKPVELTGTHLKVLVPETGYYVRNKFRLVCGEDATLKRSGTPYVTVFWGDGSTQSFSELVTTTHSYPTSEIATYDLVVSDGVSQISFGDNYITGRDDDASYATYNIYGAATIADIESIGAHVTSLGSYAFSKMKIEDGLDALRDSAIVSIGNRAFYEAEGTALEGDMSWLPSGVTSIGFYAFSETPISSLAGFPSGMTDWNESGWFANCASLTSLDGMPSTVTALTGSWLFEHSGLTSLHGISPNITSIPPTTTYGVFSYCRSLTNIEDYPPLLNYVPYAAFEGCTALTNPSSTFFSRLDYIQYEGFRGCTSLGPTLTISKAIALADYSFYGCTGITTANFTGVTYMYQACMQGCSALTTLNAPNTVIISTSALRGITTLTSVTMTNCHRIGDYAMYNCWGLTTLSGPAVTYIGQYAMASQYSTSGKVMTLTSVSFPNAKTIGKYAFNNCPSLMAVDLSHRSYRQVINNSTYKGYSCNMSNFPWRLPKNCVITCRDGKIKMTSAYNASTAKFTISNSKAFSYNRNYDGCHRWVVKVDHDVLQFKISFTDGSGGEYSTFYWDTGDNCGDYYNISGGTATHTCTLSGLNTMEDANGCTNVVLDDKLANIDLSDTLGVKIIRITEIPERASFAANAFLGQDELEYVEWPGTKYNLKSKGAGSVTENGVTRYAIFGAPATTVFRCSDGTVLGDGTEGEDIWYSRRY